MESILHLCASYFESLHTINSELAVRLFREELNDFVTNLESSNTDISKAACYLKEVLHQFCESDTQSSSDESDGDIDPPQLQPIRTVEEAVKQEVHSNRRRDLLLSRHNNVEVTDGL